MHGLLHQACVSGGVWRMFRFCCVGTLNTGFAFCLYVFFSLFVNIYLANVLSWSVACAFSYFMNRFWTFCAADTGFLPLFRFVIVNLCSLGFGLTVMYILTSLGSDKIWSYVLSLPITVTVSYLGYRFWTFKKVNGSI